jgi:AcrR family transcriptional regulator
MGDRPLEERIITLEGRICDAMLACVARWGVTKTTLEDVAREAGCGRATIYRTFQGGKGQVLRAVLVREAARFESEVTAALAGSEDAPVDPDDLTEVLTAGVVAAARFLAGHAALDHLLAHEPDVVLPHVAFHRLAGLFALVGDFAVPHLARFVGDGEPAHRAAEWLARVVLTYVLNPSDGVDLTDPVAARHLLSTYVVPGLVKEPACPPTST